MKLSAIKKKYPKIEKNKTFQSLWEDLKSLQKKILKTTKKQENAKKNYLNLKANKSSSKKKVSAWKKEQKQAQALKKKLGIRLVKVQKQIKKWLGIQEAKKKQAIKELKLKKKKALAKKKKVAARKVKKNVSSKKESSSKPAEKPALKAKKTATTEKPPGSNRLINTPVKANLAIKKESELPPPVSNYSFEKPSVPRTTKRATNIPPKNTSKETANKLKEMPSTPPIVSDNFKLLSGIGIKIEQRLKDAGIPSFDALSKTSYNELKGILEKAGPYYRNIDPDIWLQQAKLAAAKKWDQLEALKQTLKRGK